MLLDEFRFQLMESMRIIVNHDGLESELIYRFHGFYDFEKTSVMLVAENPDLHLPVEDFPVSICSVIIDHNPDGATVSLRQALDWLYDMGECGDTEN